MKVISKDLTIKALKIKLRDAQEAKNENMMAITNACITIIAGMPEEEVFEGFNCGQCHWYDKATKRCTHKNGLMGRLKPGMYCSYGSPSREEPEEDEDDFEMFEEDMNNDQEIL